MRSLGKALAPVLAVIGGAYFALGVAILRHLDPLQVPRWWAILAFTGWAAAWFAAWAWWRDSAFE